MLKKLVSAVCLILIAAGPGVCAGNRAVTAGFDAGVRAGGLPAAQPMVMSDDSQQTVGRAQLVAMGIAAIRDRSGVAEDGDLTITELSSGQDNVVPAGGLSFAVELPYGIRYNMPTTVSVSLMVDGRLYAKEILKFDVRLYRQVVVAARNMAVGETVTTESVRYERMDVGRLAPGYVTDMDKLAGLVTRRSVASGQPLNGSMVQKPVMVKRGSIVTIVARVNGIEVSVYGQSLQNGREGQVIRVKNINSNKTVAAKVIDSGTVEVLTRN
jgi:flagella basal body P-ring formation protein FlgA